MKKKMLAGLLAAAMVMTALTGCGAKDSSTKPAAESTAGAAAGTEQSSDAQAAAEDNGEVVELEFWAWWSSDARKPYVEQMVQDFNDSQSKYHVTYVDIPWGDIFTKNIAQIALRWILQRGILPLPKSVTRERIVSNAELFDFSLSPEDMKLIDRIRCEGSGSDPDTFRM